MIRRYHRNQLERIAEAFLEKHGKFDNRRLMVELTVQKFGIYLWVVKGLGQYAEAFVPYGKGRIYVDEDLWLEQGTKFNFVICEEIAHLLIHAPALQSKSIEDIQRFQEMMTMSQYKEYERDARYLASCLLMRKTWFVERFRTYVSAQSMMISNQSKVLRYAIRQLAMDFSLPVAPVALRAVRLDLITEADFTALGYLPN